MTDTSDLILAGVMPERLTLSNSEVRQLKRSGLPQARVKAAPAQAIDEKTRTIRFVASDETPDRVGDVIAVNGWNLSSYKANPVVLWGHDQTTMPPIGKASNVYRGQGHEGRPALLASIEFAPKESYEFAETVYQLAKGGFLNAVSVGFLPRETREVSDKERRSLGMPSYGVYYTSADLLEISVVSVPANPSALVSGAKSLVHRGVLEERVVDRFLKSTPMTEEELAERLKAKIRGFVDLGALATKSEPEAKAAKPGQIKVGDMVSYTGEDEERSYGRVERIKYEGRMQHPDTKEMTDASPDNPAALINEVDEKMSPKDKRVVRRFADLKRVKMMEEEDEDKMEHGKEEEEEKSLDLAAALPESIRKHVHSAYTEEGRLVVEFDLAMMEGEDEYDDEVAEVAEKSATSDIYTGLVAAQTEQTKALTTLIDSISDLTKRIHAMSEVRGGSKSLPDAKPSDAHDREREEKQLQQLTEDFLTRIKRMR